MAATTTPIPSPYSLPFVGHVLQIERELPIRSFMRLAKEHGEIYQLNLLGEFSLLPQLPIHFGTEFTDSRAAGRKVVMINSSALLKEMCDPKRFIKAVSGPLAEVRHGLGDGLFTVFSIVPVCSPENS